MRALQRPPTLWFSNLLFTDMDCTFHLSLPQLSVSSGLALARFCCDLTSPGDILGQGHRQLHKALSSTSYNPSMGNILLRYILGGTVSIFQTVDLTLLLADFSQLLGL